MIHSQNVVLLPYGAHWVAEFARESGAVAAALGNALIAIHHIGSTAVPGIHAKPIIDMLLVSPELSLLDERVSVLEAIGYEALGEFGIPGRRYFRKNNSAGERTHQIHAFRS
ncbi:MAG: GrpB family protein, partial [Limisphaerales bacterium]